MARPKVSSKNQKKQHKSGIDFKKIKRKVGRKLPPPKNATNTDIKAKAIILPEQSVSSEKAGLAVSKKGLTLKELLQQTSHYNVKVRRDALMGIKDLLAKYPEELKLHKYVVIEKLRERISDEDKMVRETLYQLLKLVIFPSFKEDNMGPFIPLMMTCIFNAMTHLAIDVRLMALKFIVLVVQNHSQSFSSYADKILQNYVNILQRGQLYLQDKSKLKSILAGLVHCLKSLPCKKREFDTSLKNDVSPHSILHDFEVDLPHDSGSSAIVTGLKNLMLVLADHFHEIVSLVPQQLDSRSFECMLCILQSVDLSVSFSLQWFDSCQPEFQTSMHCQELISPMLFKKLWDAFPLNPIHHFSEKDDERCFILNSVTAKILLQSREWSFPPVLLEKIIIFLESALAEITAVLSGKACHEKHVISLLHFLPKLISQTECYWKCRLLQAFTDTFKNCRPESSLKLACLSSVEAMLLPQDGMRILDAIDPDTLALMISWIREIPLLLIQLGDKHPSCSKAMLRLLLRLGQGAPLNSSLVREFDNLQNLLLEFYCTFSDDGTINYGPFTKLSDDPQKLSISCLYYFSFLDPLLLKSLTACCLCHELQPGILFQIIEVLQTSYKAGHIQIGDHLSFFITLLARFEVLPENVSPVSNGGKDSNRATYRSLSGFICSYLYEMGDHYLISQIMENVILDQILVLRPLDNICALLRVLVVLGSRCITVSEQRIIKLGNFLTAYVLDVAYNIPESEHESCASICIRARRYYLIPCFFLFERNTRLLNHAIDMMGSLILHPRSIHPSFSFEQHATEDPSRIIAVASVLLWMCKDVRLQQILVLCKHGIDSVLHHALAEQSSEPSKFTIEGRHRIKCACDRLGIVTSTLLSGSKAK